MPQSTMCLQEGSLGNGRACFIYLSFLRVQHTVRPNCPFAEEEVISLNLSSFLVVYG